MSIDLNVTWYILVGVLLGGYAILDGFDLGVGALHLFTKKDEHRRLLLNSIGPVWDGNEVWLITGGGALFAAFPEVYATAFSGFYIAFMLLLFSLIFRAVSIEFRSKQQAAWWRSMWDTSFSISSVVASLLIGVAMGNVIRGIPLAADHEFAGTFFGLLNPYSIMVGLMTVVLFTMHGSIYLVMKTEGELQSIIRPWVSRSIFVFILTYVFTTLYTMTEAPHMLQPLLDNPILFLIPVANLVTIIGVPFEIRRGNEFRAFLSSCVSMLLLMALFGIGMFPNLLLSQPNPEYSLNIINAASSQKTLEIMLIIAVIGVPLVLAYTASIYWVFRGKVKITPESY